MLSSGDAALIHGTDFAAALEAALPVAARAPSSHNSQPWGLASIESREAGAELARITGSTGPALVLALDRARALTTLDAHALEMHLSCGMFAHLLVQALASSGWRATRTWVNESTDVRALPLSGWPVRWRPLAVYSFSRGAEPIRGYEELAELTERRITNRAPYRTDRLPRPQLDRLRSGAPGATFVSDREGIEAVARFVGEHAGVDFSHAAAWRETHDFIRWSEADARGAEDGFAITQLFGPLSRLQRAFYRTALNPSLMRVLAPLGYAKAIGKQLGALVAQSGALAAFTFPTQTPSLAEQLDGGATVLEVWLRATAEGLVVHPVSVVLQHPEIRRALESAHHFPGRVFFLARLGERLADFPPAPRRKRPWSTVVRL